MNSFDDILNHIPDGQQNKGGQIPKEEYAERKKAERDEVYALADSTAMDAVGDGGKFQQYLGVQSKFDRYSTVNAMLILAQRPNATRIGDFEFWKSQGGSIKGGQTAFSIIEPGKEYVREDGTTGTSFNVKKVFDISQVDTRKLKVPPKPNYSERQLLSALVTNAPVRISGTETLPDGIGAKYDTQTDSISVRKGMGFADTFRALAQELAHVHLTTGPDIQADARFSAYCTAYLLCEKYGVDTKEFDFSGAPAVLDGLDVQDVRCELTQIQEAAADTSRRMSRNLEAIAKAAKNQEAR